ncbi:uncharacterized protein NFIA_036070 [Aspergillus fischeri NRRL 181]|uniref:Uncharacterized protein n=1 Tax=Neosartorya fischeri (strain ATCC 1020 / DSM 3700 / CBS 544.65 / FGSC A1164 / JCM 1740 / NRRL 181 / WB 181) TaxID=331117 RepID=A1CZ65_NEOFI|nr:conserved hypothetical protein [Aspergillus fischeri NRRL 181]XP_001265932.1 conserved hypothetical protein [Aspergillus fischeri NRRL 181]EAW22051.1 conserved hypothetical protein [Aspergillus fischeri NRRL 181]EAW24035.1 conserved hypothetical protein [Aspergillus fischeri NRRL 181]
MTLYLPQKDFITHNHFRSIYNALTKILMASLATNTSNFLFQKWYIRYLSEVADGRLELPPYEEREDGSIKIYYGELFCRVPDCSKSRKKYTATNNLRTHLETHGDIKLQEGNSGGRVPQKTVDEATKWYKRLFYAVDPQDGGGASTSADTHFVCAMSVDAGTPSLPVKKDGTVHVTNMRKKVAEMGRKVPCSSCGNRNDCCKDINKCAYFVLFNCGNITLELTNGN